MIAVVGGFGVGMTMRVERAPEAGETVSNGSLTIGPGGKGSNQAIAIARLGHKVALFTAIGDDAAGREARELWAREGVDGSKVVVVGEPTMTGFITVDATGENRISIAPGALELLTPADVESFRPTIGEADLLVVSLEVPVAVAMRALAIAAEEGTRTVLNPAPAPANASVDWTGVSIITPNLTEAITLLGAVPTNAEDSETLALRLAERFGCSVVLTLGHAGSVVQDGATFTRVEPFAIERVVDSTGAGDAHTAALVVALAEGLPLERAAKFAAAAGALAVTVREVVPALPYRELVDDLVARTSRRPS